MEPRKQSLDLANELTCSICTELLYQPLTLLDCLHTFCGACLKEWFRFQADKVERAPSPPPPDSNPFTCPSCRSAVRDTKHNATVVTLLDMFVAAHPGKARSDSDKAEMAQKYKPGDQVLPKLNIRQRTAEERRADDEDRRLVEEVREMSLREAGAGSMARIRPRRQESSSADELPNSSGEQSSDGRSRVNRHRVRRESRVSGHRHHRSEHGRRTRSESHQRQVEHQSSIRSLIGADMSERDIQREIEDFARQIQDEGLLDGLDLDNIDLTRDDELSRRITEAYRRRQRERSQQDATRRSNANHSISESQQFDRNSRRRQSDSGNITQSRTSPDSRSDNGHGDDRSRPPASMQPNLEVQNPARRRRRRTASGSRSSSTPVFSSDPEARPAARSQTDLTLMTQTADAGGDRPDLAQDGRRSSSHSVTNISQVQGATLSPNSNSGNNASFASRVPQGNLTSNLQTTSSSPERPSSGRSNRSAHRPADLAVVHSAVSTPISSPTSGHQRTRSLLYPEPSISCSRCEKPHIEYEVHYNCTTCSGGQWNICIDCYRRGKGCLYWFGFGYGAWNKWEKARQTNQELARPHMLTANRYLPPPSTPGGADGRKTLTTDDPKMRLETGTFCAQCSAWTNNCYWRCDVCNEGDWGFCNDCVNQGRSCTHMLLPLTHEGAQSQNRPRSPRSPGRPLTAALFTGPQASNIGPFKPLTFNTRCDVCQEPISPTQVRYHCFSCTSTLIDNATPGDYDICSSCYGSLVDRGQIASENGYSGWRRCLNGHRMVTVGFTGGKVGQWRYVDRDLVGGRTLRAEPFDMSDNRSQGMQKWSWQQGEEKYERLVSKDVAETAPSSDLSVSFAQTLPPDGGFGWRGGARWAWYPQAGADDELLFPRGAEIREIEDVNGEWYWGTYMGAKGLFPAPYVRVEKES